MSVQSQFSIGVTFNVWFIDSLKDFLLDILNLRSVVHIQLIACSCSLTLSSSSFKTDIWLSVRYLSQMACRLSQTVKSVESSPKGSENNGSATTILKGVLESCFSKTSRHRSCLKRALSSSNDQVISLIFDSQRVCGIQDLGALS